MKIRDPQSEIGYGNYLRFRDLVLERSGLHFPEKKRFDLETGLLKALAASPLVIDGHGHNLDEYYRLLTDKNSPIGQVEMDRLVNILTIGETHFFRNEPQFNALANEVLPALIRQKRATAAVAGLGTQPQLRIWSAGCATGEEPYSLAILLKELLPDIVNWRILILATDINQDSLNRAKEATYSNWSFREPRAKELRSRYFTLNPTTKRYHLQDDIRQMVTFASLNLIEDKYPAIHNNTMNMDLILCRNVTIYFTETITRWVVKRFYDALVEGGWFVVGHSEPSLVIYRAFQSISFPDALLYQRTGQPTPWPDDWDWLDGSKNPKRHKSTKNILSPSAPLSPLPKGTADGAGGGGGVSPLSPPHTPGMKPIERGFGEKTGTDSNRASPYSVSAPTFSSPPPPHHPVSSPPDVDPYELAHELLNKGRATEAINALDRKLTIDPDFAPAHSLLGRAFANLGHWAEAQRWCQSALELDKLLAEPYYILGLVYQHEDQIDTAIDMLKKAIYLERDAPLPHFNLAMLYKQTGQLKKARRTCQNVIRILEKRPLADIIPNSDGVTVNRILKAAQRILDTLERNQ